MKIRTTYPAFNSSIRDSFINAIGSKTDLKVIVNYDDIKEADLIAFPGGEDVDPRLYRMPNTRSYGINKNRDERETFIYRHAVSLNKPMFGMCRGLQFLAVMKGYTLVQDIYSELEEQHGGGHSIDVLVDSIVSKSFKQVNSLHHQGLLVNAKNKKVSLKNLALSGLYVTSSYGSIAESIESENIIATQFHPEFMHSRESKKFFELLASWVEKPSFTFDKKDYEEKIGLRADSRPTIEEERMEYYTTTPRDFGSRVMPSPPIGNYTITFDSDTTDSDYYEDEE